MPWYDILQERLTQLQPSSVTSLKKKKSVGRLGSNFVILTTCIGRINIAEISGAMFFSSKKLHRLSSSLKSLFNNVTSASTQCRSYQILPQYNPKKSCVGVFYPIN